LGWYTWIICGVIAGVIWIIISYKKDDNITVLTILESILFMCWGGVGLVITLVFGIVYFLIKIGSSQISQQGNTQKKELK